MTRPLLLALTGLTVFGQTKEELQLARQLAQPETRTTAIRTIADTGRLPLLLEWTASPPAQLNTMDLFIGLADAFGELRRKFGDRLRFTKFRTHRERGPATTALDPVIDAKTP